MIYLHELKKLALSPLLPLLAALCVAFNLLFLLVEYDGMAPPRQADPIADAFVAEAPYIFDGYRTADIADFYVAALGATDANAQRIRAKYEALQRVVDRKAAGGELPPALFDGRTSDFQALLFGKLFKHLVAEIGLLALFAALLSTTYEQLRGTEPILYASKTGRRVQRAKLGASLTVSAALSALVIGATLSIFFARFDFAIPWDADVSRVFDHALGETKPFVTWQTFTVAGYLWAVVGIGIGLALCGGLLGFAAGTATRGAYRAVGLAVSTLAVLYLVARSPLLPYGSIAKNVVNLNPVWLWQNSGTWFTDGRADMLWPHFELLGSVGSLLLLAASALLAYRMLLRRELS